MTETSKQPSASRESPVLGGDSQRLPKSPLESPGEMGKTLRPPEYPEPYAPVIAPGVATPAEAAPARRRRKKVAPRKADASRPFLRQCPEPVEGMRSFFVGLYRNRDERRTQGFPKVGANGG